MAILPWVRLLLFVLFLLPESWVFTGFRDLGRSDVVGRVYRRFCGVVTDVFRNLWGQQLSLLHKGTILFGFLFPNFYLTGGAWHYATDYRDVVKWNVLSFGLDLSFSKLCECLIVIKVVLSLALHCWYCPWFPVSLSWLLVVCSESVKFLVFYPDWSVLRRGPFLV